MQRGSTRKDDEERARKKQLKIEADLIISSSVEGSSDDESAERDFWNNLQPLEFGVVEASRDMFKNVLDAPKKSLRPSRDNHAFNHLPTISNARFKCIFFVWTGFGG